MPTYTTLFNSSKAGAGIIHGNLIKYGLAALLAIALLGNKKS